MVTDIPTHQDFAERGVDYLNLGWGRILEILGDFAEAEDWASGLEPEMEEEYWIAAEREIGTALTLACQGAEFLLKSKICEVSPWLLISSNPSDWPRGCSATNIAFSQYRTLDSQDLIKVVNTVCDSRLSEEFTTAFSELRVQRNSLVHTVDDSLRLTVAPVLRKVLVISEFLLGPKEWRRIREEFLDRDRESAIRTEHNHFRLVRELMIVMGILSRAELLRFFGFNKRQRTYFCPRCRRPWEDAELECRSAVLRPNKPSSTKVYCFICDDEHTVERQNCVFDDCKGNAIDTGWDECLTCGGTQEED